MTAGVALGPPPSLIKWTGSKRSQALRVAGEFPDHGRYFEPFLGGGSLLYLTAKQGAVAGDLYAPLIDLWTLVRDDPARVADNYRRQWKSLQRETPDYFYRVRERFNRSPNPLDLSFLMRTCVNGIARFNRRGEFNNSFHLTRQGMRPDRFAVIVDRWNREIQGVRFVCQDYEETLASAVAGDLAYFDPPYAGNKQRYVADLDLDRFFETLEELNRRDVQWALSFDGSRGDLDLTHDVPESLFRRRLLIPSGPSAVGKVLNRPLEQVHESLYLNY
ncbi:MAG: DNA adenine methylase [Planctomycetales bacterium]